MKPGRHRFHLVHDGHKRRYLVQVPSSYDDRSPLPAVVMFHGAGATARWVMLETGLDQKAEDAGFLAVFPEGLPPHPGKLAEFLHNPLSWNDGSPYWSQADDLGFMETLFHELPRRFAIDPGRIYLTGFSNGAGFAFTVATQFSDRIAALACVAGHCWLGDPHLKRPIPTFYVIGTQDPLLPMEGGEVISPWGKIMHKPPVKQTWLKWARALGCSEKSELMQLGEKVQLHRFTRGISSVIMDCYTIEGHGHHWPGGRGQLDEKIAGKNDEGLNANDQIWDFFQQWTLK